MMIFKYQDKEPKIGRDVFIAPNAVIVGDVEIGDGASIWFGAVLRGDEGRIIIGANSNVQDNAVLHTTAEHPTVLAEDVTIGHGALLEGCTIEAGAVVGMGAVVLAEATVGAQAMIAAGSVVARGFVVPSRMLAAGSPAVIKKELTGAALHSVEISAPVYRKLAHHYRLAHPDNEADRSEMTSESG